MMRDHLQALRELETERVAAVLISVSKPPPADLLEIGAGTGFQAARFARHGYAVSAIDVAGSNFSDARVWPVQEYDGRNIPFEDNRFDVVFSSNVLEHVSDLVYLGQEMGRVLKDDGVVVHVLPSSAWRIWSCATHYAHLVKRVSAVASSVVRRGMAASRAEASSSFAVDRAFGERMARVLLPGRHGERGNVLTEIYYFSRAWWRTHFASGGWDIVRIDSMGIFYTGYAALGLALPLAARQRLARVLGAGTTIFVLRKRR